jgi:hypothetical protein
MFEELTVGEILKDLRSVKLPVKIRAFVDQSRSSFQSEGNLPIDIQRRLRSICNQYKAQLKELHAARARARRTNGLKAMGISREEAARRVAARRAAEEAKKNDVGF